MVGSDLKYYLSGGTANTNPDLSLGGIISTTQVGTSLHGLFDKVTPEEASAGDIEYRAIFVKNTHVSETAYDAVLYVSAETTSTSTIIAVAYDSAGSQTVVNENTAPSSPAMTFTTPLNKATGVALGDMAPSATKMIWFRRTVTAGAVKLSPDAGQITVIVGSAT